MSDEISRDPRPTTATTTAYWRAWLTPDQSATYQHLLNRAWEVGDQGGPTTIAIVAALSTMGNDGPLTRALVGTTRALARDWLDQANADTWAAQQLADITDLGDITDW